VVTFRVGLGCGDGQTKYSRAFVPRREPCDEMLVIRRGLQKSRANGLVTAAAGSRITPKVIEVQAGLGTQQRSLLSDRGKREVHERPLSGDTLDCP
jgi:hypothetical protein